MANLIGCSCDNGNGNTGLPECSEQFDVSIGLGIQRMVAADGTSNRYDLSAPITTFVASLTNTDKTKRMFPITNIRNVDFPKEDTQYLTDNSGQKEEIREGIQSFTAEKWKVPAAFDLKLKQMKCNRNGTWGFTRAGVWGIRKGNYWTPVEINAFAPTFKMQTAAAPSMEMIAFDWNATVNVGEAWLVSWTDLGTTYEEMIGLMDANFTETVAPAAGATTSVSYKLTTDYGSGLLDNQTVDGLVAADFTAFNQTTGLAVVITTVTENADVDYDFILPSQTAADVMRINVITSSGYEGNVTFVEP
jgi:hypothetical protein